MSPSPHIGTVDDEQCCRSQSQPFTSSELMMPAFAHPELTSNLPAGSSFAMTLTNLEEATVEHIHGFITDCIYHELFIWTSQLGDKQIEQLPANIAYSRPLPGVPDLSVQAQGQPFSLTSSTHVLSDLLKQFNMKPSDCFTSMLIDLIECDFAVQNKRGKQYVTADMLSCLAKSVFEPTLPASRARWRELHHTPLPTGTHWCTLRFCHGQQHTTSLHASQTEQYCCSTQVTAVSTWNWHMIIVAVWTTNTHWRRCTSTLIMAQNYVDDKAVCSWVPWFVKFTTNQWARTLVKWD